MFRSLRLLLMVILIITIVLPEVVLSSTSVKSEYQSMSGVNATSGDSTVGWVQSA